MTVFLTVLLLFFIFGGLLCFRLAPLAQTKPPSAVRLQAAGTTGRAVWRIYPLDCPSSASEAKVPTIKLKIYIVYIAGGTALNTPFTFN